eukprot:jgi/Psemu1/37592/gm1.37592_g
MNYREYFQGDSPFGNVPERRNESYRAIYSLFLGAEGDQLLAQVLDLFEAQAIGGLGVFVEDAVGVIRLRIIHGECLSDAFGYIDDMEGDACELVQGFLTEHHRATLAQNVHHEYVLAILEGGGVHTEMLQAYKVFFLPFEFPFKSSTTRTYSSMGSGRFADPSLTHSEKGVCKEKWGVKKWSQLCISSYSEVSMDNDAFNDYAAASMLTQEGIKKWFKEIILGQAADVMFDSLCQKIILKLLKFLVETAEERKRARSKRAATWISFHMKLSKMLQHRNKNGVISAGTTLSDEETRIGIASRIVLILKEEMKKKQSKGLVKEYAESKMAKEQGKKKHLDVRDVNKILGSIEDEESENSLQLRKEMYFLSSIRFYAEEALQSQVYLDKCYDSFLRSSNSSGRLRTLLVNEQYFHFGVMSMKKVSASVDQEKLGNNPDLLEVFLDCTSKGNIYLGKLSEKKKIFAELGDKVINARFSEEIRAHREEHAARGTKYKGINLTMREEIDVIVGSRQRARNSDAGRSIEERKEE